ncbi:hypothetical protein ACWIGI_36305 [Nocardia sp. NPDC055321]
MGGDVLLLPAMFGPLIVLGWAAMRAKRRWLGGSFAGPFQEMFDPDEVAPAVHPMKSGAALRN